MNGKSKVFGLLAAIGLSLSMVGVAAANDAEAVSVDLLDTTGVCTIDFFAFDGSFGTWEYDAGAGAYVETSGESSIIFIGEVTTTNVGNGCDITINFGGLTGPGGTIDTSHFWTFSMYQGMSVAPAQFGDTGVGAGGVGSLAFYDFVYRLESVPDIDPGTYSGHIYATISNTP